MLLVEQNITVVAGVAERALVMVNGRIALAAGAAALATDETLQRRHLGVGTSLPDGEDEA